MSDWPSGSYRIFISYSREDAHDIAIRLRDDLAAAGHDAWLDLAEIPAGASWARDIENAIENCDIALLLLSQGSYVSDICRSEQLRAMRKNKRAIPMLVQPDADRPLHLENLNYVDFADLMRYDQLFSDLLSYIETGYVPEQTVPMEPMSTDPPVFPPPPKTNPGQFSGFKRDARAFRRYLEDLRGEAWLGERHWWTYALFYYADVQQIAKILTEGAINPPANNTRQSRTWDRFVRLNFRPRTPDLYGLEGILPEGERDYGHCPAPVYLLFDLESIITQANVRFSPGDVTQLGKTYQSAVAFRDLPFDMIYHDRPFTRHERDEILTARRAQVMISRSLELDQLRHIWCRSAAEYETLRLLLPDAVWQRFGERVTARADYELFNRHRTFVHQATLVREGAHIVFNPCKNSNADECGPFNIRAELRTPGRHPYTIELGEMTPDVELALDLTAHKLGNYEIRLFLDDALAYVGRCGVFPAIT